MNEFDKRCIEIYTSFDQYIRMQYDKMTKEWNLMPLTARRIIEGRVAKYHVSQRVVLHNIDEDALAGEKTDEDQIHINKSQ
jgi:hypothetical protein